MHEGKKAGATNARAFRLNRPDPLAETSENLKKMFMHAVREEGNDRIFFDSVIFPIHKKRFYSIVEGNIRSDSTGFY